MSQILFMILFIVVLYGFAFRKQIQKKCLSYFFGINEDIDNIDTFLENTESYEDKLDRGYIQNHTPISSPMFDNCIKNTNDMKNNYSDDFEKYFNTSEDCDVTYRKTAILQGESAISLTEKSTPSNDESSNESQKYQATSMQDIFPTDRA